MWGGVECGHNFSKACGQGLSKHKDPFQFQPPPQTTQEKISHGRGALQLHLEKNWSKLLHEHETNPHYIIIIITIS
jgi:hypothetical protein